MKRQKNILVQLHKIMGSLPIVIAIIVFFSIKTDVYPQKYETGKISLKFIDIERNNRKVPVDIYYPEDLLNKDTTAGAEITERFPVICFGHGYLISGKWYEHIIKMIVPEGFILMFPGSETGLFPSHRTLARDMNFALNEILKIDSDTLSSLYNRIDSAKCIMGHSMGGGSAFLAANLSRDAKAIAALAPFDTNPSAVKAASSIKIPILIFAGSNDCITPPGKHQEKIYYSSISSEKTYILIKGGTHCQMGVSHPKCEFGEKLSGCGKNNISQEDQLEIISRYVIPWLKFYLKNDYEAVLQFNSLLKNDESVEYMHSAPLLINNGMNFNH